MEKILVTGASGFIGRDFAIYAARKGYEVHALSRFDGEKSKVADKLKKEGINVIKCDMLSDEARNAVTGIKPNIVVHSAVLLRVQAPYETYKRINVDGTQSMLDAAKMAKVNQFVYLSTAAVYGRTQYLPIDEKHPTAPDNPYSITKLEGEGLANNSRSEDMKVFIPRLFNVYGPHGTDLINRIMRNIEEGKAPVIYGDGSQEQDFIYISDIAPAIETAIKRQLDITVNVGTGKPITLIDLVNRILKAKNSDLKPNIDTSKQQGPSNYADTALARKNGIEAKIGIDEGLARLLSEDA